ncbi:hypothetical protein [Micromonospora sp. IBHARD004]|uniref:hypothetical protein n=1 Tax=Micromonospora sp. IBHARD004 TaxID=3457764 RepID=UPI00405A29A3
MLYWLTCLGSDSRYLLSAIVGALMGDAALVVVLDVVETAWLSWALPLCPVGGGLLGVGIRGIKRNPGAHRGHKTP